MWCAQLKALNHVCKIETILPVSFIYRWNTSIPGAAIFDTKPSQWMQQNIKVLVSAMASAGGTTPQACDHTAFVDQQAYVRSGP